MTRWLQSICIVSVAAAATLTFVTSAGAQSGSLGAARELYAAAAYDEALSVLNRLRASAPAADIGLIEQYRALCLLALERRTEADAAIEAAVTAAPFAQPSDADVSPHVRSTFRDVRRRVLPAVIEREYTDAKTAFDRKDSSAADRFTHVLALIADPDLQSAANEPRIAQLRAMATDFLALRPPKPAPPAPPPPLSTRVQAPPEKPAAVPPPRDLARIYSPEDTSVVPPTAVRQSFAPMAEVFSLRPGIVEIVIDETGAVVTAATKLSVNALYDRLARATAMSWRYRPAILDDVAVKYRLIVTLQLPPRH